MTSCRQEIAFFDDRSTGDVENHFTWQGKFGVMNEAGTNIYYNHARYYDAGMARFLSRDPVQGFGVFSSNPYQYGFQNPLLYTDPNGLNPNSA